jgi:hypothetical protein
MNLPSRGLLLSMLLANAETGFADLIFKGDLLTQFFGPFSVRLPSNVYILYVHMCVLLSFLHCLPTNKALACACKNDLLFCGQGEARDKGWKTRSNVNPFCAAQTEQHLFFSCAHGDPYFIFIICYTRIDIWYIFGRKQFRTVLANI